MLLPGTAPFTSTTLNANIQQLSARAPEVLRRLRSTGTALNIANPHATKPQLPKANMPSFIPTNKRLKNDVLIQSTSLFQLLAYVIHGPMWCGASPKSDLRISNIIAARFPTDGLSLCRHRQVSTCIGWHAFETSFWVLHLLLCHLQSFGKCIEPSQLY